jgi:7-carboxy-7-deazaguanine synthase (Cx14CxxC type)
LTYSVKEIFYTIQGEGANAGAPAVFCRFSGCNLWSGLEKDRATAVCQFCDTDFFGTDGIAGGAYVSADSLADAIDSAWKGQDSKRFVVLTGGEPLLQVDEELVSRLRARGFRVAVETNGTRAVPAGVDWVCVSPKAGAPLVQRSGDELKVVCPQRDLDLDALAQLDFTYFYLQPMDGQDAEKNLKLVTHHCLKNPKWRVSIQLHKLIGVR